MRQSYLSVLMVIGAVLIIFAFQPEQPALAVLVFYPLGIVAFFTPSFVVSFHQGSLKPLDWLLTIFMLILVPAFWLVAADSPVLWVLFVVYPAVAARMVVYWLKGRKNTTEDTARNTRHS